VKLSSLEHLSAFALLGPGFGGGGFTLLRDLEEGGRGEPRLVFAEFERRGKDARVFGARAGAVEPLELDVDPPRLSVRLEEGDYYAAVARIREAIAAGDVYQVCHTVRARVGPATGAGLFAAMASRGAARFAAWVRLPGGPEFVSASPELFLATEGGTVRSEPMKGTARAGADGILRASAKDRAELAMITDLVRNDLTPVCRPRSVRVPHPRRFLHLPYAMQAVSDVAGDLLDGVTPLDVLDGLHPGGSVTGAPKRAALRMIAELEAGPRGPYCGALGLCRGDGCTFSLLIRTATRTEAGWVYGVGSGIVYDSEAEKELAELHVKLGGLGCGTPSSA